MAGMAGGAAVRIYVLLSVMDQRNEPGRGRARHRNRTQVGRAPYLKIERGHGWHGSMAGAEVNSNAE